MTKVKIDKDHKAVPCRICEKVFGPLRLTWVYWYDCKQVICEGEHGRQVRNARLTKWILHYP